MSDCQRSFLDVEDDERRQNRIGGLLARLNNASSSTLGSSNPALNIRPEPPGPIQPPTELLARVQAFLPAMAASNDALSQMKPKDIDIENMQGDEEQCIEMNLGLGVLEAKPRTDSGSRSISPSSDADSSSDSSGEPESDSESLRSSSEEDSSSSSSSSDDDSDSESQSGSSVDMKPIFSRPIRPLPRRVSGQTTAKVKV